MAYWLVKSPFRSRTWARVVAAGQFQLYGIRNAQARNNIAQMQPGDEALFYFQQTIWGIMHVASEPTPDTTSASEKWLAITFEPVRTLEPPVSLETIRTISVFQSNLLLRQPRLSVISLTEEHWQHIIST
jgi:predicted RNA-binding protein with PUA-like domain